MKQYLATAAVAAYVVAAFHSTAVRLEADATYTALQAPEAQTSKSVWDGVYSEEQAKRGAALYKQWCSSCHGAELEGGEMAPGLVGGGFTSNWNGLTIGDIFDRTRTTMPQDSPGALSREQVADVTAFVLATQSEMLKQIKFEATKPGH